MWGLSEFETKTTELVLGCTISNKIKFPLTKQKGTTKLAFERVKMF